MANGSTGYAAGSAYDFYFTNFTGQNRAPVSTGKYGSKLKTRIDGFFANDQVGMTLMTAAEQYRRDVACWYGAIEYANSANKKQALLNLFGALYFGGLLVYDKPSKSWAAWNSLQAPIASAISHSARVLLQLPKTSDVKSWRDPGRWTTFWNGLFQHVQPRSAATHKINVSKDNLALGMYFTHLRTKYVAEDKPTTGEKVQSLFTKETGGTNHYYINVALGGNGNINPFSGKTINDVDGRHGHVYYGLRPATANEHGGLLVATEQSASSDAAQGKGFTSTLGNVFSHQGIPDQYGGSHGVGGHNRYSATCGDDWGSGNLAVGVRYYDGMFLDVSQEWQVAHILNHWGGFRADKLNKFGHDPVKPTQVPGWENFHDQSKLDAYLMNLHAPKKT